MQCEASKKTIVKCELEPIAYEVNGKSRLYYPDFLVEGREITEIKHLGFIYEKKKDEIKAKQKALEYFCCENKKYVAKFVTNEDIEDQFKLKAKRLARKFEKLKGKKK